jgi:hypothetical protein
MKYKYKPGHEKVLVSITNHVYWIENLHVFQWFFGLLIYVA